MLHCTRFTPEATLAQSDELSPSLQVKLLDLGLAWEKSTTSIPAGASLGSTPYLSPEMFDREAVIDPSACDRWALGVSLHNMLTGKFPFNFGRLGRPRKQISLNLVADEQAKDLIGKLLSKDPSERPTIEQILAHEFIQTHFSAPVEPLSQFSHKSYKQLLRQVSDSRLSVFM